MVINVREGEQLPSFYSSEIDVIRGGYCCSENTAIEKARELQTCKEKKICSICGDVLSLFAYFTSPLRDGNR